MSVLNASPISTPNIQHPIPVHAVVTTSEPQGIPLCTLADPRTEQNADWRALAADIYRGTPDPSIETYRSLYAPDTSTVNRKKVWETTQITYSLRALGLLDGDKIGFGVGVGKEPLLYYLTRHTSRLYATDLYGFGWVSAPIEMLNDPTQFAPYDYPRDRLTVLQMDAANLPMPDACVDFVYSISSIEHFGGPRQALAHVRQAARILKPGGVLAFSTEYVLQNGAGGLSAGATDFFNRTTLEWLLLNSGLERIGPMNLTPQPELISDPAVILLPEWVISPDHFDRFSSKLQDTIFTDVTVLLRKPF
jgi:SAM-dependent methyltransferase